MGVVAMQKVAILAHSSLRDELLDALHKEGILEIADATDALEVDHTEVEFRAAELQFAITTLKDVASKNTLAAAQKRPTEEGVIHAAKHTDVRGIVDVLHTLEEQDTESERKMQEYEVLQQALQPWLNLRSPLNSPNETRTSRRILGTIPEANFNTLETELQQKLPRTDLSVISTHMGLRYVVASVWKEDTYAFEEIATSLGWTTETLPELDGVAAELYENATMKRKEIEHSKRKNHEERVRLSVELPNLMHVALFMRWLDEKQEVRESMANTHSTITLLGWMPKNRVTIIESRLQKVSPAIAILKVKADEGEEPPVLIKNSKLVTPFESVTGLYGLPLYNEMDPTRSLSPFFILFFGLCLTDAGYGAIIAILFGIVLLKTKKTIEEAPLLWLLFMCGIVTFFVSIPFGGWFGLQPEKMPEFLTKTTADGMILFKGQVWNLSHQSGIEFLQNLSLVLGLTHLFFGMWLAGMHKWIHGKKAAAFWVDFTSHILLGAVIFYVVQPSQVSQYVLYGAIAMIVWGKGHGAKWFVRPIVGLLGMVNFGIGMLSNSLSYLRILALGLVTGALALAVNQVAVELGNLFPAFIGIPVVITIFLIGHLVSIALNTLGSFIHSGRLQFIEFFSQFFEGGGKTFSPFRRSTTP